MKTKYENIKMRHSSLEKIVIVNDIIEEYQNQGYDLTLRQLYYQMVSRSMIANNQREYNRLGVLVAKGRMAGLIDWDAIVDRTRYTRELPHWDDEADIINGAVKGFRVDKWENQEFQPQVWIEKDALIGVISGICNQMDIPYMSCRGYLSQSALYRQSVIMRWQSKMTKTPVIIHLGDHDPSGVDMSRDIRDRLKTLRAGACIVERVALNYSQVEQYNPPPNPAKLTDSRIGGYLEKYGASSWELDALEPSVITQLIRDVVDNYRDDDQWQRDQARDKEGKAVLTGILDNLEDIKTTYGLGDNL